jgi:phosphatidate cytidylyltransferase
MVQRLIVTIFLIPLAVGAIYFGGWIYALLILGFLGTASWEYWNMFRLGGFCPSRVIVIGGVVLLWFSRVVFNFNYSELLLSLIVLSAMFVHTVDYERGTDCSAASFAVTVAGVMYLGWIGAYLISIRSLPNGAWWTLTVIPAAIWADTGGYVIGKNFGKHKLAPRVSPKKTWEGYLGGILFALILTPLLAACWHLVTPAITPLDGLIIGAVISVLAPLGDLGESMLKRQFGLKDSSNLLPGHGGSMDRIDSWLWAAVIGYYLVLWLK